MIDRLIFLVSIFFYTNGHSQIQYSLEANIGLNRIGLFYELGTEFVKRNHVVSIGARLYEPDLVFEKDFPGLSLAYEYGLRKSTQNALFIGVAIDAFTELKDENRLWLYNPRLTLRGQRRIAQKWSLNLGLGFGGTINMLQSDDPEIANNFVYVNYELAFGFIYHIGSTQ
ncbi:hypothetical protein [Crocinitomix algicola]|uniref:hypothetical protein n=1 Tax=Crocinitomix algicola TaxID=1740263 RepID=UPI0008370B57|nr:hypothetical protein [Crocinitomix algicola]